MHACSRNKLARERDCLIVDHLKTHKQPCLQNNIIQYVLFKAPFQEQTPTLIKITLMTNFKGNALSQGTVSLIAFSFYSSV